MGLAGLRDRRKIDKDPNNTKWARNTNTFGQRMLRSQGWNPGETLGAKDASHAEFHTAASASHIRVVLKEDNLGLGAKRSQADECTGLDDFKDLLGRLNGKSEVAVEADRNVREELKLNRFMRRRYGPSMRFVSAGFLIGDHMPPNDDSVPHSSAEEDATRDDDGVESKETQRKEKKSNKRKAVAETEGEVPGQVTTKEKKKRRKDKGAMNEGDGLRGDVEATGKSSPKQVAQSAENEEVAAARKEKSKKRKPKRTTPSDAVVDTGTVERLSRKDRLKVEESESTRSSEAESAPVSGRHLARRRFIAQKRRAVMDPAALKQIFMIKT